MCVSAPKRPPKAPVVPPPPPPPEKTAEELKIKTAADEDGKRRPSEMGTRALRIDLGGVRPVGSGLQITR